MSGPAPAAQTPRELVELWAAAAAGRVRAEQASPGTLSGTELNRLGELLISAASWLTADAEAARNKALGDRIAELKRSPRWASMSFVEQMKAQADI